MALKSNWAYRNGRRTMKEAKESNRDSKTGWIESKGRLVYAERYEPSGKLMIKTYANKKQCNNKIDKLILDGVECEISETHPFIIIKADSSKL